MRRTSAVFRAFTFVILTIIAVLFAPPLFAQGGLDVPSGAPWYVALLATVFPIVSGWLSNLIMDGVRQLSAKLDAANVVIKQVISVLIALGVSFLTAKFGATLDPDLHNWTAVGLNALFTILAQQGIYKWKSDNQAAKQGTPTLTQRRMGLTPRKVT